MPKVSEEHSRARRQEILDAAARCFARAGFHRTTIQDIVRESGLSAGLIYRYFADKDGVVTAIAAQWHERQATQLHLQDNDSRSSENLDRVTSAYLEMLRSLADPAEMQRVQLSLQVWAETLRSPQVHAAARQGVDLPRSVLADLIRDAQLRGDLSETLPADGVARVFIAIYQGLELQTAWEPELDNTAYVQAVEALIAALAPSKTVHQSR